MTNLNADVKKKQKASVEDCRTYCRHVDSNTFKLHESEYRRDQIVQIFVFIGTPTQRPNTSLSIRAIRRATVSKIITWKRPGNVKRNGFRAMCNVDDRV